MSGTRWWVARRVGVSAFLAVHLAATAVWVLPPCPIRAWAYPAVSRYMMPLGLWQSWAMFAPDPPRETVTLEADAVDARGLRAAFAFPKLADYSALGSVPRFRHAKYAMNLFGPGADLDRRLAARHVVRQLAIPAEAFPVDVHLIYQVRPIAPPGAPPADPATPARPYSIGVVHFSGREEVTP